MICLSHICVAAKNVINLGLMYRNDIFNLLKFCSFDLCILLGGVFNGGLFEIFLLFKFLACLGS